MGSLGQLNALLCSLRLDLSLPSLALATPLLVLTVLEAIDHTRLDVDRTDRVAVQQAVLARVGMHEWDTARVVQRILRLVAASTATEPVAAAEQVRSSPNLATSLASTRSYPSRPSSAFSISTGATSHVRPPSAIPQPPATPRSTLRLVRLSLEREGPIRPKALFRVPRPASAAAASGSAYAGQDVLAASDDNSECECGALESDCESACACDHPRRATPRPSESARVSPPARPYTRPPPQSTPSNRASPTSHLHLSHLDPPPTSSSSHRPPPPPRPPAPTKTSGYLSLVSDSEITRFEHRRRRNKTMPLPPPCSRLQLREPQGWSWARCGAPQGESDESEERELESRKEELRTRLERLKSAQGSGLNETDEPDEERVRCRRRVVRIPMVV